MHSSGPAAAAAASDSSTSSRATEAAAASASAPNQEQEQEQEQAQQQVNLRAHLSGGASSVEAALDSGFGAASEAANWPQASSGSRQINREAQRIKVTLSLPRSSTNETNISQADPTTTAAASTTTTTTLDIASNEHQQQQPTLFDPKRRQSTATLISAAESSSSLLRRPTQTSQAATIIGLPQSASFGSPILSATTTGPIDRAFQERELRRIASQRATTQNNNNNSQPTGRELAQEPAISVSVRQNPPSQPSGGGGSDTTAAKQRQQLDVVPNHKQLAIYINGKIRSNSIFCQTSSLSDSFHNILSRFHSSPSEQQQKHEKSDSPDSGVATNKLVDKTKANRKKVKHRRAQIDASGNDHGDRRRLFNRTWIGLRVRKSIGKYWLASSSSKKQQKDCPRSSSNDDDDDRPEEEEEEEETEAEAEPEAPSKEINNKCINSPINSNHLTTSYKLNPSSMFLRKAMRYYRLWIYCTNVTILLGTLLFIIAVLYVASDYRIPLIINESGNDDKLLSLLDDENNDSISQQQTTSIFTTIRSFPINFTEPSMLFAFVAVAIQAGILQIIGCFGAVRMKEKFIQLFWYMILALTVLDILFLVYWLLRYDLMVKSLNEHMKFRLNEHFGSSSSFDDQPVVDLNKLNRAYLTRDPTSLSETTASRDTIESTKFDKIFTNIINRIQSDSRCCGIASPLDYRRTKWRLVKLKQLENKLNWTSGSSSSSIMNPSDWPDHHQQSPQYGSLLSRVPLVAGSCCRRKVKAQGQSKKENKPVILDDSELASKVRVPAWAPSNVVEDLQERNQQRGRLKQERKFLDQDSKGLEEDRQRADEDTGRDERVKSLADIIDERWTPPSSTSTSTSADSNGWPSMRASVSSSSNDDDGDVNLDDGDGDGGDDDKEDWRLNKQQRRLLAKQDNYNLPSSSRDRRWAVESSVDSQERVSSRLIEDNNNNTNADDTSQESSSSIRMQQQGPDDYSRQLLPLAATSTSDNLVDDERGHKGDNSLGQNEVTPVSKLASLRRVLFRTKSPSISSPDDDDDADDYDENSNPLLAKYESKRQSTQCNEDTFRWPNKLQLNYQQYKTLESYLLAEEEARLSAAQTELANNNSRSRRSIFSSLIGMAGGSNQHEATTTHGGEQRGPPIAVAAPDLRRRAAEQLKLALEQDHELGCAPRSHFDNATIYTRGCEEPIRAWLDRSAHILFVTGFCVLSMLKLFSLLLLRLELREMIHKIRVLKGMATEYNALHDLEAYLPRSSVCAQAAELTPSGVTAAVLPAASATAAAVAASSSSSAAAGGQPGRICGGSFSETVAAATLAAAANNPLQQLSAGAGPCRASSMKTVTTMLAPSMCPRSSSASAAHLQQRCFTSAGGACGSLRSDLFGSFHQSAAMLRRHTAVSVCPAAAAAAAAAAAHHLMSRRGTTYLPHSSAFPLVSPSLGLNLNQHRHSAHAVHTLPTNNNPTTMMLLNPAKQQQQQQQQRRPSSTSSAKYQRTTLAVAPNLRHYLGDMARNAATATASASAGDEAHNSSMDSNQSSGRYFLSTAGGISCQQAEAAAAAATSTTTDQQQLLYPTFKRQSSTGAQSACNFSLDPRPAASILLAESRRSIH